MAAKRRRLYGLCSADDGVIRYIGSTTVSLNSRRDGHLRSARNESCGRPVNAWILEIGSRNLRIVPLGLGDIATERAEIARRVAAGEPLLNVRDGGVAPPSAGHRDLPGVDAHHHESGALVSAACPTWVADLAESPQHRHRPPTDESYTKNGRAFYLEVLRPIRPREPLHINAWRDRLAARLAAGRQESEAAA